MEQSTKWSLNSIDWKKIGIGAAVALGGTLLTYLTQVITSIDFGVYTPIVVSGWSILVNIARKWIADNTA